MRMPVSMLRRCLGYWLSQNVLKQDTEDVYVVQEKRKDKQDVHGKYRVLSIYRDKP